MFQIIRTLRSRREKKEKSQPVLESEIQRIKLTKKELQVKTLRQRSAP